MALSRKADGPPTALPASAAAPHAGCPLSAAPAALPVLPLPRATLLVASPAGSAEGPWARSSHLAPPPAAVPPFWCWGWRWGSGPGANEGWPAQCSARPLPAVCLLLLQRKALCFVHATRGDLRPLRCTQCSALACREAEGNPASHPAPPIATGHPACFLSCPWPAPPWPSRAAASAGCRGACAATPNGR